jgi:hypothetical protein
LNDLLKQKLKEELKKLVPEFNFLHGIAAGLLVGLLFAFKADGIVIASLVISTISLVASVWAISDVLGFKRSTHKVQFFSPESLMTDEKAKEAQAEFNRRSTDPMFRYTDDFYGGEP